MLCYPYAHFLIADQGWSTDLTCALFPPIKCITRISELYCLMQIIRFSVSLSGFTNAHLAEFQRELNSAVLKDMRSNKDNIAVTVLALDITRKESKSCVFKKKIFKNVFQRSLFCSPMLHLFDQKYNNTSIVKNYVSLKNSHCFLLYMYFKSVIYPCDGKAEFSASLLQSSVSRDLSEIILT